MANGLWTRPILSTIRRAPSRSPPPRNFSSCGWVRLCVSVGPASALQDSLAERKPNDEAVDNYPQPNGCHRGHGSYAADGWGVAIPLPGLPYFIPRPLVYRSRRRGLRTYRPVPELG